ncbi:hypothetical protein DPMN_050021 [Dreissena polymorpha]|uniref:Uncharacterized protein n=1 Tax=Dreissena polymorpha TaxID=45954 RepID=A0A9D4CGQ5_DREPO|nr:hypothetical protein DPMN_050021 [Dreissena polymorpha]
MSSTRLENTTQQEAKDEKSKTVNKDPKAGDKRNREIGSLSSVSEADSSLNITPKQKKQKQKPDQNEQNDNTIMSELKEINKKLSNVLTKDSFELRDLVKGIVNQLKEELLGSITLRVEHLEGELFEKTEEDIKLSKEIEEVKTQLKNREDENEKLRKSIKTQEKANEYKFNDIEQYSKRSNIKIEGI